MKIDKSEQFVCIPRLQFEEMEKKVQKNNDVNIQIEIFVRHLETFLITDKISVYNSIISENENINSNMVWELIIKAKEEVEKIYVKEIEDYRSELKNIKSKWWYKLFNFSGTE